MSALPARAAWPIVDVRAGDTIGVASRDACRIRSGADQDIDIAARDVGGHRIATASRDLCRIEIARRAVVLQVCAEASA